MTKKCVIFDIDGTLALDTNGRVEHLKKSPKDWEAYFAELHLDKVNEPVAKILRMISTSFDVYPIYVTGRPEKYRTPTLDWLEENDLPTDIPYYARANGDFRGDDIIKVELLKKIEAYGFEVIIIFDDRNRVVKALREAGYCVAQVAEGDF